MSLFSQTSQDPRFSIPTLPTLDSGVFFAANIETHHTIILNSVCDKEELKTIKNVFKNQTVRELVPLNPRTLIIHSICVHAFAKFQLSAIGETLDENISCTVLELFEYFVLNNTKVVKFLPILFNLAKTEAIAVLNGNLIKSKIDKTYPTKVIALRDEIPKEPNTSEEQYVAAIALRVANLALKRLISAKVEKFISSLDERALNHKYLPSHEKSRIFIVNGGIASGKGTAVEGVQKYAKETFGIEPQDLLTLNTDSFKKLVWRSTHPESNTAPETLFSQYTHDEAALIRNQIFDLYVQMRGNSQAPHLFVDQVWPAEDIFTIGASSPTGIDATIVQIPVEQSLTMAFKRGESTQRFEATKSILSTHAGVPRQLHKTLELITRKGFRNARIRIVANIGIGKISEIAYIDLENLAFKITDLFRLHEFYKKTTLNLEATRPEELYIGADPSTPFEMVSELKTICNPEFKPTSLDECESLFFHLFKKAEAAS